MRDDELERIKKKLMEEMLKKTSDKCELAEKSAAPIGLTEDSIGDFLTKNALTVVDFWAGWCGPCRMMAPILKELASEYAGRVAFGKLNVDDYPEVAAKFGIMSIPTLLIFKDGKFVDAIVGAVPKSYIEAKLSSLL